VEGKGRQEETLIWEQYSLKGGGPSRRSCDLTLRGSTDGGVKRVGNSAGKSKGKVAQRVAWGGGKEALCEKKLCHRKGRMEKAVSFPHRTPDELERGERGLFSQEQAFSRLVVEWSSQGGVSAGHFTKGGKQGSKIGEKWKQLPRSCPGICLKGKSRGTAALPS